MSNDAAPVTHRTWNPWRGCTKVSAGGNSSTYDSASSALPNTGPTPVGSRAADAGRTSART